MRVAVLGWGSLIWNPGCLRLGDGEWRPDGPVLPIEFARISGSGEEPERLTLTLREGAQDVPTLWSELEQDELDVARANLAQREKCAVERIGYVGPNGGSQLRAITDPTAAQELLRRLEAWRVEKGFDAVIWTDLRSNFEAKRRDDGGRPLRRSTSDTHPNRSTRISDMPSRPRSGGQQSRTRQGPPAAG